jgi:hypothetical protein
MNDPQTYYKIRHKVTKRWSKGGVYANAEGNNSYWVEKGGKTWDTLGKLRAHITSHLGKYSGSTDMSNWEVVEYKMTYQDTKGIHSVMDPKKLVELLKR